MSDSRYQQLENNNNQRLDELASKLSTFRQINSDIHLQAQDDMGVLDNLSNHFGSLMSNLKNSSTRLTRSMRAGTGIWKMVGLALVIFFVLYTLYKVF
ncbi:hypothetical protein ACO0RG_001910 [Hanseniaspora osmophila]